MTPSSVSKALNSKNLTLTKARHYSALGSGQVAHQEVRSQQVSEIIFFEIKEWKIATVSTRTTSLNIRVVRTCAFRNHTLVPTYTNSGALSLSSASNERPTQCPAEMGPLAPGRGPNFF